MIREISDTLKKGIKEIAFESFCVGRGHSTDCICCELAFDIHWRTGEKPDGWRESIVGYLRGLKDWHKEEGRMEAAVAMQNAADWIEKGAGFVEKSADSNQKASL